MLVGQRYRERAAGCVAAGMFAAAMATKSGGNKERGEWGDQERIEERRRRKKRRGRGGGGKQTGKSRLAMANQSSKRVDGFSCLEGGDYP